jgi:hypothetical protein
VLVDQRLDPLLLGRGGLGEVVLEAARDAGARGRPAGPVSVPSPVEAAAATLKAPMSTASRKDEHGAAPIRSARLPHQWPRQCWFSGRPCALRYFGWYGSSTAAITRTSGWAAQSITNPRVCSQPCTTCHLSP